MCVLFGLLFLKIAHILEVYYVKPMLTLLKHYKIRLLYSKEAR